MCHHQLRMYWFMSTRWILRRHLWRRLQVEVSKTFVHFFSCCKKNSYQLPIIRVPQPTPCCRFALWSQFMIAALVTGTSENQRSRCREKANCIGADRYGNMVKLKTTQGLKYNRNTHHVKWFVTPVIYIIEWKEHSFADPPVVPREQMVDKNSHPPWRWEQVKVHLRINVQSSHSHYQGNRESHPTSRPWRQWFSRPNDGWILQWQ